MFSEEEFRIVHVDLHISQHRFQQVCVQDLCAETEPAVLVFVCVLAEGGNVHYRVVEVLVLR